MMTRARRSRTPRVLGLVLLLGTCTALAQLKVQCLGDLNNDAIPDPYYFNADGTPDTSRPNPDYRASTVCRHLSGGDGFAVMADGAPQYIFGFADVTGVGDADKDGSITDDIMDAATLAAEWPAPTLALNEGENFYLTLSNVGMPMRPDLFDAHTVHYHGFPNSSTVFDGLPESGISVKMFASLTYFYPQYEPGTFLYHCHVEATEHMQMGMLGSLFVRAKQSVEGCANGTCPRGKLGGNLSADAPLGYVYNDNDGSTAYDVEYPLQLSGFDPNFHNKHIDVQPLPFAMMWDRYAMLNGRGYPDTVNPGPLPPVPPDELHPARQDIQQQPVSSLIAGRQGDRILLRISQVSVTQFHTLISPSIPMRVVGIDAKELRSTTGDRLHYLTNSVTLGGGETADVILDTTGVAPGTYFLYASNLNYLSNDQEDFGGMMTEIVINP